MPPGARIILVRHGECTFEAGGRRPGLIDTDLTEDGLQAARDAAVALVAAGAQVTEVVTSPLERATRTAMIIARAQKVHPPVRVMWHLLDRHLGVYTGARERDIRAWIGAEAYRLLDRSPDATPPALAVDHPAAFQVEFAWQQWPLDRRRQAESLVDVIGRVRALWTDHLQGRTGATDVAVVAHHDTLRALRVVLEDRPAADIAQLSVDVGAPVFYRLAGGRAAHMNAPPGGTGRTGREGADLSRPAPHHRDGPVGAVPWAREVGP